MKHQIQLHISIFLFGLTAILGKILADNGMTGMTIVWWRMLFTCVILWLIPNLLKKARSLSRQTIMYLSGIGVLVATHWVFFYASIKASNASITLSCFATNALFTALIEPVVFKKKIHYYELFLGMLVIPGVALVVRFAAADYMLGIVLGLVAAFFSALFSTLNKAFIEDAEPIPMTFVELTAGFMALSAIMPFYFWVASPEKMSPDMYDTEILICFALFCTVVPYILSVSSLKGISAFSSNLAFNLEPVYGIILAILFLHEDKELNAGFYIGMAIILLAVFSNPLLKGLKMANSR